MFGGELVTRLDFHTHLPVTLTTSQSQDSPGPNVQPYNGGTMGVGAIGGKTIAAGVGVSSHLQQSVAVKSQAGGYASNADLNSRPSRTLRQSRR